jgi:hypothetical protein
MTALLDLAGRVEAATGADRELDRLIELTLPGVLEHDDTRRFSDDPRREPMVISGEGHRDYEPGQGYTPPRYTASLDAAMTLTAASDVWGVSKQECRPGADYYYRASVMPFGPIEWGVSDAATPALALCAAALKARALSRQSNGGRGE